MLERARLQGPITRGASETAYLLAGGVSPPRGVQQCGRGGLAVRPGRAGNHSGYGTGMFVSVEQTVQVHRLEPIIVSLPRDNVFPPPSRWCGCTSTRGGGTSPRNTTTCPAGPLRQYQGACRERPRAAMVPRAWPAASCAWAAAMRRCAICRGSNSCNMPAGQVAWEGRQGSVWVLLQLPRGHCRPCPVGSMATGVLPVAARTCYTS